MKSVLANEFDEYLKNLKIINEVDDEDSYYLTKNGTIEIEGNEFKIREKETGFIIFYYEYYNEDSTFDSTLEIPVTFPYCRKGYIDIIDKQNKKIIFSIPIGKEYYYSDNDYVNEFPWEESSVYQYNIDDTSLTIPKIPDNINGLEVIVGLNGEIICESIKEEDLSYKSNNELKIIILNNFKNITGYRPSELKYYYEYDEDQFNNKEDWDTFIRNNGVWDWEQIICDEVYNTIREWLELHNITNSNDQDNILENIEEAIAYRY